jgi:hypothetical protein
MIAKNFSDVHYNSSKNIDHIQLISSLNSVNAVQVNLPEIRLLIENENNYLETEIKDLRNEIDRLSNNISADTLTASMSDHLTSPSIKLTNSKNRSLSKMKTSSSVHSLPQNNLKLPRDMHSNSSASSLTQSKPFSQIDKSRISSSSVSERTASSRFRTKLECARDEIHFT